MSLCPTKEPFDASPAKPGKRDAAASDPGCSHAAWRATKAKRLLDSLLIIRRRARARGEADEALATDADADAGGANRSPFV